MQKTGAMSRPLTLLFADAQERGWRLNDASRDAEILAPRTHPWVVHKEPVTYRPRFNPLDEEECGPTPPRLAWPTPGGRGVTPAGLVGMLARAV